MTKSLGQIAYYADEKISSQGVTIENFVTVDNLGANKSGRTISEVEPAGQLTKFMPGDTLIGNIRPYLRKIWFADRKGGCTQDVLAVRPNKSINARFLYYALFRDDLFVHMMKGAKGTKMPRGDRDHVLTFKVPEFGELEQKKIAAVLSVLDAKIELNRRINAELERLAKTIYDYWFVQFDFPDANGRPYRSSGGKMTYNPTLKRQIPDGWEVCHLEERVEIKNGFAFKSEDYKDAGLPIVRTKNFHDGSIILDDVVFLSEQDAADYDDFRLEQFDLLIVMVGASVGNYAVVPSYLLPALQNQNMWNFRPKSQNKQFSNLLMQQIIDEQLHIASGSARSFFQKEYFYSLKREIAPDSIASKFDAIIKPLFDKRDLVHTESRQLAALRDWLLPMLMNGQVTVE